jgi:hypothetical protein
MENSTGSNKNVNKLNEIPTLPDLHYHRNFCLRFLPASGTNENFSFEIGNAENCAGK